MCFAIEEFSRNTGLGIYCYTTSCSVSKRVYCRFIFVSYCLVQGVLISP